MNTLTLLAARDTVARALKVCPTTADGTTNTVVTDYLNEAQWRLLNRPHNPVGSTQLYAFRTIENCVVLPRQVRTVLKGAWCSTPARVQPVWFSFDMNGPGQLDEDTFIGEAIVDQGTTCTFDTITGGATTSRLRVTTDVTEDSATYLWVYGYDENNQWVRTVVDGVHVDGERIDLSAAPVNSASLFTVITRVHKDVTRGIVRVYEYSDTTAAVVRQLGQYEPSETDPIYRRVMLPDIDAYGTCCGEAECDPKVTLLVKLQHVPVLADLDAFVLGNLPALKLMCLAIQAEEEQRYDDSLKLQQLAAQEIDGELASYLGAGTRIGIGVERYTLFGAGGVENLI